MKIKLLTGLLSVIFALNLNAWGLQHLWHDVTHAHIKSMSEAEYTNKTLKKDTDFATVSILRTHGRDFMLLVKPKTENILIKIQTENDNQIVSNLNDVNLSKTYKINCRYTGNLTYECKSVDSDYNLIDYESFKLENGRNYLTIQNPFDDKVKTIGWFQAEKNNNFYFAKK